MEIDVILSILTSVLTGGILVIFIESISTAQLVESNAKYSLVPFFHKLTNYLAFVSMIRTCYNFKDVEGSYNIQFRDITHRLGTYGGKAIVQGADFPINYFSAEKVNEICSEINALWAYADKSWESFRNHCGYDSNHALIFKESRASYLFEVFPNYPADLTDCDILPKVSGDFYAKCYQPVESLLYKYKDWQNKENSFTIGSIIFICGILLQIILALFFQGNIMIIVLKWSTALSCIAWGVQIIYLAILVKKAKGIY